MGNRVAVMGAGGHGKVVADVALSAGHEVIAFIDDASDREGSAIWGIPVLTWEGFVAMPGSRGIKVALAIGDNAARFRCRRRIDKDGFALATLVHRNAVVSRTAVLGAGTVVMAAAVVNPDVVVGDGCIINTAAIVEHDCVIGDFAHLSPNAAMGGGVRIGALTHLGVGAVVLPRVRIGAAVRVGAGAVVIRDVQDRATVVGVPARPIVSAHSDELGPTTAIAALLQHAATADVSLGGTSQEVVPAGLARAAARNLVAGVSAGVSIEDNE